MAEYSEAFVGIDVAKLRNAVAIADDGRDGEVRYFGEVDASEENMCRLVKRLAAKHERLHFCLIPKKPSDRVKTNRRDALSLARLLRAGELTAVWVPDTAHEAIRSLVRARTAAVKDVTIKKRQVTSFLLRHHRSFSRKAWGARYRLWLHTQTFEHPADHIVFHDSINAVLAAESRRDRLDLAIEDFVLTWSQAPIVHALQALRGVDLVTAVNFVVEIGDIRRFENPRRLMGYLGLVPGERSTGESVRRGSITKMGNPRIRALLVESAWTYRHPPRVSKHKAPLLERTTENVRAMAWRAQTRLTRRYRALAARGMKQTVICTAIARELAGFMWAVAREATPALLHSAPPAPSHRLRMGGGEAAAGGIPVHRYVADLFDARCKIGTAPDASRKCGSQPRIRACSPTSIRPRLHPCAIIHQSPFGAEEKSCAKA